jgi:ferredoxin
VRVTIDPTLCAATGYCAELAPTVFRLPESGPVEVIVVSPEPDLWEVVREAEGLCPTNAIATENDGE